MQTKMFSSNVFGFLFVIVAGFVHDVLGNDSFNEELFIRPLTNGHVYFQFEFTTKWDADIRSRETFQHYRLFPKSLGEVISAYNVQELHLSLTQGLWRYEKWGYPKRDAPPGAELWVWFQDDTQDVDRTWTELNHALSGLFCATLNFMDSKSTTSPKWSYRPSGLSSEQYARNSKFLRYSALPREIACTENLTPWKKLLPCDSKVGLSTLFNTVNLYDANYHSLSIHIRPVCTDKACSRPGIELTQSLGLVFDSIRITAGSSNWNFKKLFNRGLTTQCPLADVSRVYVDLNQNQTTEFSLSPAAALTEVRNDYGVRRRYAVYEVGKETLYGKHFNLGLQYSTPPDYKEISPPPVYAQRYMTGHGLEKGGVACHLYNNLPQDVMVIYLDTLPWYMRVYYNTIAVETNGSMSVKPTSIHFVPGRDRERLYTLEMVLTLRAHSVTTIRFQFDRAFLKWTEYPPDANHGFYVNSAVISVNLPVQSSGDRFPDALVLSELKGHHVEDGFVFLRLHTESLLLQLPTPDFSMPYNVICLACTVVAIAFGSLHNLTTRRFQITDPKAKKGIVDKIRGLLSRVFKKKKSNLETECDQDYLGNEGDKNESKSKDKECSDSGDKKSQ